jgi:hypothetical protein
MLDVSLHTSAESAGIHVQLWYSNSLEAVQVPSFQMQTSGHLLEKQAKQNVPRLLECTYARLVKPEPLSAWSNGSVTAAHRTISQVHALVYSKRMKKETILLLGSIHKSRSQIGGNNIGNPKSNKKKHQR